MRLFKNKLNDACSRDFPYNNLFGFVTSKISFNVPECSSTDHLLFGMVTKLEDLDIMEGFLLNCNTIQYISFEKMDMDEALHFDIKFISSKFPLESKINFLDRLYDLLDKGYKELDILFYQVLKMISLINWDKYLKVMAKYNARIVSQTLSTYNGIKESHLACKGAFERIKKQVVLKPVEIPIRKAFTDPGITSSTLPVLGMPTIKRSNSQQQTQISRNLTSNSQPPSASSQTSSPFSNYISSRIGSPENQLRKSGLRVFQEKSLKISRTSSTFRTELRPSLQRSLSIIPEFDFFLQYQI